ncbi:MAG: hypothetical protein AAB460_03390 [Patescibacteria group bacterium]
MVRDLLQLNTVYKRLLIGCVVLLVSLLATYGLLLKQTVAHVVLRKSFEEDRRDLTARVGTLERTYLGAMNGLTLDAAMEKGFIEKTPERFVARTKETLTLNYSNE